MQNISFEKFYENAKTLKINLAASMKNMQQETLKAESLPEISAEFTDALRNMITPEFDLVVCGEVKRGKSTFINALIGQELLPMGVKETTSQVFRVTHSDTESFFLVFDDGSQKPIAREQLSRYGSQVDADLEGEAFFEGKRLNYIQVNVPIEFLPEGATIVDTPGLGALYKSHEEITHKFIKNADAVVFVLDADKPLVQQEKKFLEKHVFPKTPNVMFVMTKVDTVDEQAWVEMIRRNETLLKEAFEEQCYNSPKVFPVASTLLFDAVMENDAEEKQWLIEDSLFPDAKNELSSLVARTVGLFKNTIACGQATLHHHQVMQIVSEQIQMVSADSKEEQLGIKKRKQEITKLFEEDWGQNSVKRKDVIQTIKQLLNGTKVNANQLLSPGSGIHKKYLEKIEALTNQDELLEFSKTMSARVIGGISDEWSIITETTQNYIRVEINKMHGSIQELKSTQLVTSNVVVSKPVDISEAQFSDYFLGFRGQMLNTSIVTSTVGTVGYLVGAASLGVFFPILAAGGLAWALWGGVSDTNKRKLANDKAELKKELNKLFDQIRDHMLGVSMAEGKHTSTVDSFILELQNASEDAISKLYSKNKIQIEAESKLLDKQAKLNNEEKQKLLTGLNEQRQIWSKIGATLSPLQKSVIELQNQLN